MTADHDSAPSPTDLRTRLAEDLAAGKTIALSMKELDDPAIRAQLPSMLEELSRQQETPVSAIRLPGYTMLGEIAAGGQSTVHLARHDLLGRHVAVKIPDRWAGRDDRAAQRFLQEARAMARLSHPNIVAIHDIVEVGGTVAIAMEWVDGLTLASLLRTLPDRPDPDDMGLIRAALGTAADQNGRLIGAAAGFFVRLVHDVACAVQAVHEAGLLHLDIKPSNVLVRRDGTPLLADFGVVREMTSELSKTRTFAGTLTYAPPEQLRRQDDRFGPHTDVYSLGMTLYEALARTSPMRGIALPDLLSPIEHGRIPRLSSRIEIAADLENVVHKAIDPEPEHRYATAAEFADDLRAFLEHRPVAARPLSRANRLRRWIRNEPWKAALAAALLVLVPALLGLGGYLVANAPKLEQLRREEQWREAKRLTQVAYQARFAGDKSARFVPLLDEAMRLDPGDSSLACLVAAVNEDGPARAAELLARHPDALSRSLGLRIYAERAATGRSFFDDDEVARLAESNAVADRYVLALDRLNLAEETRDEQHYARAQARLADAILATGPEPLLYGLQAWVSLRAGDEQTFAAVRRAIELHWPDDPLVHAWLALSLEVFDRDAAMAISRQIAESAPTHPCGWELLVGASYRARDFDAMRAYHARAAAAGVASTQLDLYVALADADAAEGAAIRPAAERVLALRPDLAAAPRWVDVLDPPGAIALCDNTLADPDATPIQLGAVHRFGCQKRDERLVERAWQRYRESYPDRLGLHLVHAQWLLQRKDRTGAAEVVRHVQPNRRDAADSYPFIVRLLQMARAWPDLQRAAERWLELADASQAQEAAFYAGLAAARLGDCERAAGLLATALHAEVPGSWQVRALLEDAWLRVAPSASDRLRDPGLALLRLESFDARNRELRSRHLGRWMLTVRAEVLFANGERERAAEAIARARASAPREPDAPDGLEDLIRDAERRYGH